MSATIDSRAAETAIGRSGPATAPATARPAPLGGFLRNAALTALPLYAVLVLSYPPALTGRISVPTSPGFFLDVFDLTMAALMPTWLVFPVLTGIGDVAARAVAALVLVASLAAFSRQ